MNIRLALLFALSLSGVSKADHHHKEWWKFLDGTWTFEHRLSSEDSEIGQVTFSMAPIGEALVGKWTAGGGRTSYEVAGWQSDKKMIVSTGYGSDGGYWHIEFSQLAAETMGGKQRGYNTEGGSYDGEIVLTKTGSDSCTWEFVGKTSEGEELKMSGQLSRKKQARVPERPRPSLVPSEAPDPDKD